ncbi:MAG: deoxyuridine 5'-triphosphate nucleotidohydrolase [Chlamydiae bacterium RIFCSPHIGHO2_12_FULL_49_11]|nr:MAG: deoxyuridine 5'-triphosphate nucleotidohydrolase [Chlamydiae bacterium RIFCSPHIGHO2_12_FULL_49_11]
MKSPGAGIPSYGSSGAAGADVRALVEEPVSILSGETALIPTGLFFEIPDGYEIQVRPRSGIALKHGVTVLNAPGTIDSDYRGELKIVLINHGSRPFVVENGMRIAQIVLAPVMQIEFKEVETLGISERGDGGFGHTGHF